MSAEQKAVILETLAQAIASKRKEAIAGRAASGIEQDWTGDEEFYQGYDDANRHEFVSTISKPTEGGGPAKTKAKGSTVFPNITQPYVDAAAAKVGDMLLPTDDRNFNLEAGEVPDILDEDEGFPPIVAPTPAGPAPQGGPAMPGMPPGQLPAAMPGQAPGLPMGAPGVPSDPGAQGQPQPAQPDRFAQNEAQAKEVLRVAKRSAKKAQSLIDDYLQECQYHGELRKAIDDAARIGSGVIKGPVPVRRKVKVWAKNEATGERELVVKNETKPASMRVDPWNLFPDPACGQSIHDGAYIFERDYLTIKKLGDLKGGKGPAAYIDAEIDACIEEGPGKRNESEGRFTQDQQAQKKGNFEVWYFYGDLTGKELTAAGCECESEEKTYPVLITMVNDRVIKAALNPLDSGDFPYDILPWKARPGIPWGTGIARQGRTAQRIVTAATRNLMDNAGASSKPHKVVTDDIEQDGDPWTWRASSDVTDVRGAMMFFIQPSLQGELMNIIQMGERMMEIHTGMPMIMLGMQGNVQETAAGRNIQNNNGSSVLRRIARMFDTCITEPHVRRYDTWLKMYSEDDEVKGDFNVRARGSAALVERDIQNQQIPQVLQLSLNPAFGWDPESAGEEYLKSQRFDPAAFKMTEEKKAKLAATQKPPVFPQVEAAKVREQGQLERTKIAEASETERLQIELEHKTKEGELDRQIERMQIEIDAQLGVANLSMEERLALNDVKTTLAGITMKLNTQRALSAMRGGQALAAPSEPEGRAPNGMAYQA